MDDAPTADETASDERAQLESDLVVARAELDRLRDDLESNDDRRDTVEMSSLVRAFEDAQEVVATMERRLADLAG